MVFFFFFIKRKGKEKKGKEKKERKKERKKVRKKEKRRKLNENKFIIKLKKMAKNNSVEINVTIIYLK